MSDKKLETGWQSFQKWSYLKEKYKIAKNSTFSPKEK